MKRALIVVDVQNDFCEGGSLAVAGGRAVATGIAEYLVGNRDEYAVVVATRDAHIDPGTHFSDTPDFVDSWPRHCVVGTPGAEIRAELADVVWDAVFDKGNYAAAYSGFEGDAGGVGLAGWLRDKGVDAVEVCGLATDYCVRATALDALREGFSTRLLGDLAAPVHPAREAEVFAELAGAGIEVRTGDEV